VTLHAQLPRQAWNQDPTMVPHTIASPESAPAWQPLRAALDELPGCIADLRSPAPDRLRRLADITARLESAALELIYGLVEYRNRVHPNPATWRTGAGRYPQPDPMLLLAGREWIWSLASEPRVSMSRQKRLLSVLTEILVARAAIHAYSSRLHEPSLPPLVHTLNALWLLVAECWKLRPLLAWGDGTEHE
jgi:hypothetical protein